MSLYFSFFFQFLKTIVFVQKGTEVVVIVGVFFQIKQIVSLNELIKGLILPWHLNFRV